MQSWRIVAVVLLPLYAACGGGGSGADAPTTPTTPTTPVTPTQPTNQVTIANSAFTPSTMNVSAGATVTWTWDTCSDPGYGGNTCVAHDVVFDDGSNATSGTLDHGSWSRTFATAGTFNYHCSIHGAAVMSGTVVVK